MDPQRNDLLRPSADPHGSVRTGPATDLGSFSKPLYPLDLDEPLLRRCLGRAAESARARPLALGVIAAIVATTVVVLASGSENAEQSTTVTLTNAAQLVPILWAFCESVRYW